MPFKDSVPFFKLNCTLLIFFNCVRDVIWLAWLVCFVDNIF
ncbi:hypothetical protein TMEC54S_03228 [Thauera mechernichensis]